MLSWLRQNWLALCSLSISVLAFTLSYRKFRHDTRPALIVRHGEIENVGRVVAVDVSMNLVERAKRPSGKLSVARILRPGEKSAIGAFDWPKALRVELEKNPRSMEEIVSKAEGQEVQYSSKRVASHLLTREGTQIVILRFRAVDGSKTFLRLFSPRRSNEGRFTELMPSYRVLRNRFGVFLLEKWFGKNAELAPPLKFPAHENEDAIEDGTRGLGPGSIA
jgi:hypothetical protein